MSLSGGSSIRSIVPEVARLLNRGTLIGHSEAQLLEAFIARKDEAAFEAIVTRHGPMVLNVCRQLLRDPNDVDDAFQATFLVLARRAGSLKRRDLLGNWLYGVAYRVALRSRSRAARRAARISETIPVDSLTGPDDTSSRLEPDTLTQLHEVVNHLPDRYRIPIVLCYFEGLTHEEASARLGWPLGSVKGRLARARDLLHNRLVRRGLGGSAGSLLTGLEHEAQAIVVPHLLRAKVIRSALAFSGESATAFAGSSAISLTVATLTQGVIRAMIVSQIRAITLPVLLGVGILSTGASVIAFQFQGSDSAVITEKSPTAIPAQDPRSSKGETPKGRSQARPPKAQESDHDSKPKSGTQGPNGKSQDSGMMRGGMMGMGGGMMGMGGGGAVSPEQTVAWHQRIESAQRQHNAALATVIADADKNPKTKEILKKLEEPIALDFTNETPIEDILKYIQTKTSTKGDAGIPIYVDPRGLEEAEKTLQSPVAIKLEGSTLKTTLRLILKQLGLAYCVHDGFLMISTPRGVHEELEEARAELGLSNEAPEFPELGFPGGMGGMGGGGFGGGLR